MNMHWTSGSPRQLIRALRPGGWLVGKSGFFPGYLVLHKTQMILGLSGMNDSAQLLWRIEEGGSGRYDPKRRRVIVWLGRE